MQKQASLFLVLDDDALSLVAATRTDALSPKIVRIKTDANILNTGKPTNQRTNEWMNESQQICMA